jgi:hypothetical protein
MWTPTTRQQHSRPVTRYQTDLTDAEWRVIAPHLPKPCARGRPRAWPMREIINGIFYVMRAIYRWFAAWRDDGRFERTAQEQHRAGATERAGADQRTKKSAGAASLVAKTKSPEGSRSDLLLGTSELMAGGEEGTYCVDLR